MKVVVTSDAEHAQQIKAALKETHGYCPCVPECLRTEEHRCMCKAFRESPVGTECHCGLYIKTEE